MLACNHWVLPFFFWVRSFSILKTLPPSVRNFELPKFRTEREREREREEEEEEEER